MGDFVKNGSVLYSLGTATVPETSSPCSNDWASIHDLREPGRKVDSHGAEKQCSSEHSYLEVLETQRNEGCMTEIDTSLQLGTFQDAQIDLGDGEYPIALHSVSQSQHLKSPQKSQSNFWFSDSAVTSSTPQISKWSTENSRPITAERQGFIEHDINQAELHRDQSHGLANELRTVGNPPSRSDAMEVDTDSARNCHDQNEADNLADTASGPPTQSVLHVGKQGQHANIDDSEDEDHDWPTDKKREEDTTFRAAPADVTIHPLSTSDTGIIAAVVNDVNDVEHLTDAPSIKALLQKLKLSSGVRSIVIRPLGDRKWLVIAIINDVKAYSGRNDVRVQSSSTQARMRRQTPKLSEVEDSMGLDGDERSIKGYSRANICPDGRKDGEVHSNTMPHPSQGEHVPLPKARRGDWTKKEDESLCEWVGAGKSWDSIFRRFPTRTKSAVRSRWHVVLKPKVRCRR